MKKDPRFKDHLCHPEEIRGHLEGARKKLRAAHKIVADDEDSAYQLAYEAMLKASLALVLDLADVREASPVIMLPLSKCPAISWELNRQMTSGRLRR